MIVLEHETRARFNAIALSADGRYVSVSEHPTGSGLAYAITWEVTTRRVATFAIFKMAASPQAIAFHSKFAWLYYAMTKGVAGLNLKTKKFLDLNIFDSDHSARNIAVSPDGKRLLGFRYKWLSDRDFKFIAFNISKPGKPKLEWERPVADPPLRNWAEHVVFCPDGKRFVAAEIPLDRDRKDGPRITIRDSATGEELQSVNGPGTRAGQLAMSPLGDSFITRRGKSLFVFNLQELGTTPRQIKNHGNLHFTGIAFHPSGKYLAATNNDETVKFYDTTTWKVAHTFTWQIGKMRSIAFSPDGTLAAAGSDKGQVVVWDVDL